MGDGTEENPYTREDVLRLIEENGGEAEGLDLSGKRFQEGIDLRELDLEGIVLEEAKLGGAHLEGAFLWDANLERAVLIEAHLEGADLGRAHLEGADLVNAHLEGADLWRAHLEEAFLVGAHLEGAFLASAHLEGADLSDAYLEGADLWLAHLEGAYLVDAHLEGAKLRWANLKGTDLREAHLEGANLEGVEFSPDTRLEGVHWGNYILGEEKPDRFFDKAVDSYRRLKQWYTNAGMYDVAGKFFYREMEARRKSRRWKAEPHLKLWDWTLRLLCGYGEAWWRVVIWAAAVVFGLALIYLAIGTLTPNTFWNSLYYSAVSFTALGYGNWAPKPTGWVKGLGAVEAFVGVFTMALFLVTFTRKMTR